MLVVCIISIDVCMYVFINIDTFIHEISARKADIVQVIFQDMTLIRTSIFIKGPLTSDIFSWPIDKWFCITASFDKSPTCGASDLLISYVLKDLLINLQPS